MSASDWYARKLGNPARTTSYPPTAAPSTSPQFQPAPSGPDKSRGEQALREGDLVGAVSQWSGGDGVRKETLSCPQCGSKNYFSRSNSPFGGSTGGSGASVFTDRGQANVARRCFDCNYNGGLYNLQG